MRGDERRVRRGWTRTGVLAAFTVLVLFFVVMSGIGFLQVRQTQQRVHGLVGDAVRSVELVSQMRRDLDRARLLVDEHIFERHPEAMRGLEEDLQAVQADFWRAATEYEPIATAEGDRYAWDDLKNEVVDLRDPLSQVLALSRQNRDADAYEVREGMNGALEHVDRDLATLRRLSRNSAERNVGDVARLQHAAAGFLGAVSIAGLGLTILVGGTVSRFVQSREERLRGYSASLETRNRDLDAFAGRVAHDLRGPLTTVGLAASRLERRAPGEDGSSALLHRGLARMEMLIDDLLTLSRLGCTPGASLVDPARAADEVREDIAERVRREDAELSVHVEQATVRCAPGLLRQALFNMADNAVKYRRPGVRLEVQIEGHRFDGAYQLSVRDNGMGMTSDQASRVFEPFYRAVEVRDRTGTGLGLSIVKRIADANGGSVAVDSQLGRGSRFVVTFPLADQPHS